VRHSQKQLWGTALTQRCQSSCQKTEKLSARGVGSQWWVSVVQCVFVRNIVSVNTLKHFHLPSRQSTTQHEVSPVNKLTLHPQHQLNVVTSVYVHDGAVQG